MRPEKWDDTFPRIAAAAAKIGATDRDIADILEVSERTLNYWKAERPALAEALKLGKEIADERVVRSLYHKAVGYTFDSEKIVVADGVPVRLATVEHVPPDTTACIFWLKNRRSQEWRDRLDLNATVSTPEADALRDAAFKAIMAKLDAYARAPIAPPPAMIDVTPDKEKPVGANGAKKNGKTDTTF